MTPLNKTWVRENKDGSKTMLSGVVGVETSLDTQGGCDPTDYKYVFTLATGRDEFGDQRTFLKIQLRDERRVEDLGSWFLEQASVAEARDRIDAMENSYEYPLPDGVTIPPEDGDRDSLKSRLEKKYVRQLACFRSDVEEQFQK